MTPFPCSIPCCSAFGAASVSAERILDCAVFGCLVGFGMIGAAWATARNFGFRAPWLMLSLIACNLAFVRWGDSLRAYGLGCVLIILFVGRVWAFVIQPTPRQFAIASGGWHCCVCNVCFKVRSSSRPFVLPPAWCVFVGAGIKPAGRRCFSACPPRCR